ncbi:unnamed protein product [Sphagnum tenellum]
MASVRAVVALHQTAAAAGLASLPQTEGLGSLISSVVARRNVSCSLRQAIISADLCGLAARRRCGCSCTSAVLGVKLLRPKGGVRNVRVHRSGSFRCKVSDGVSGNEEKKSGGDGEEDREGLASDITRILLSTLTDGERAQSSAKSEVGKSKGVQKALLPRMCTLRAFGDGGEGVMSGLEGSLFELVAANVQAAAQLRSFEILSGRLAMMAFFLAIAVELVTGNSVFKGIDVKQLAEFAALSALATLSAAAFAFAWRARSDVAKSLSKGAIDLVDSALDKVVDGLFYDEEEALK